MNDIAEALRELWLSRHPRPLVYIAGPYRAESFSDNMDNIGHAALMWRTLSDAGIDAVCPHTLSAQLDPGNERGDAWWLDHTQTLMLACTHVVRIPGASYGSDAECMLAESVGMPVIMADACDEIPELLLDVVRGWPRD